VFIAVYFVIDSVCKHLDTTSYMHLCRVAVHEDDGTKIVLRITL